VNDELQLDPQIEALLADERPVPHPGFTDALGRWVAANAPGHGPRPVHLHRRVGACLLLGAVLIVLGLLVAVGSL
jgi:hypothetical protein